MFTAKVKNHRGDSLQLFPSSDYFVSIDGLTPVKANLNFSTVGVNDGSIYNSGRKDNRNIVLSIKPLRDIEENRIALYKFFPLKRACSFYFKNGSRDVFVDGIVESVSGSLFEKSQTIQVSIICPSPDFKALEETIDDVSQIIPQFSFPFAIPAAGVAFSTIDKAAEKNVYNAGDAESGLIIEMRALGEVSDPKIYDEAANSFELDIDLVAGDIITINTNKGEKSVTLFRDGTETNIINLVKPNPTWFTLQPGDNVFLHAATNDDLLQIVFRHRSQYEGV